MKKLTLLVLCALVLASVFAGCSATAYMDDPYAGGYSNVSTTRNGAVNGTNGRYADYNANGSYNGTYNGTYGAYPNTGRTQSSSSTTTTGRTGSYTGTGMAGGR